MRAGLVALAVVAVCALIFYGPSLASGRALLFTHDVGGSDLWHFHYPLRHFYAESLRAGRLPFWCPPAGGGLPLLAEGQVGALYPPHVLLFGLLPFPIAFNAAILLHVLLAGVFATMLSRQLGSGLDAAILAGVVFAFAGFFVVHLKHVNLVTSAAWAPAVLLAVERMARAPRPAAGIFLAGAVAALILSGHPQIAYDSLLVAGLWALFSAVWMVAAGTWGRRDAASFLGRCLTAVLAGVLLAAPQLLPMKELNGLSARTGGLTFDEVTEWDYHPAYLLGFLRPFAFGDPGELCDVRVTDPGTGRTVEKLEGFMPMAGTKSFFWEVTGYVGILPLLLAGAAVVLTLLTRFRPEAAARGASTRKVGRAVSGLSGLLIVSLLIALGRYGGLARLFFAIVPGFASFRFPSRFILFADLALAMLAAIGFTLLAGRFLRGRTALRGLAATAAAALCFFDLYAVFAGHNATVETSRWASTPDSVRRIRSEEAAGDGGPYRILPFDPDRTLFQAAYRAARGWKGDLSPYDAARDLLDPNLSALHGLDCAAFYGPLSLGRSLLLSYALFPRDPVTGRSGLDPRIASLLNVRWVLSPFRFEAPVVASFPEKQAPTGGTAVPIVRLYRNPDALPRAFLVPRARLVTAGGERSPGGPPPGWVAEFQALTDPAFDPRREVLIGLDPGEPVPEVPDDPPGEPIAAPVAFLESSPETVRLKAASPRDCWLFLSDMPYPGWSAAVDGRSVPVHPADLAGRAVRFPAGEHEVTFRYEARSFRHGLLAALGGIALLAGQAIRGRVRSRRASAAC